LLQGRGELVRILGTIPAGSNLIEHAVLDVEDLARCIERLYRSADLAGQHSKAGLAFARALTWDGLVAQWLKLINATVARR